MDITMNDQIEQRIKTLELKVEFIENWKNTPFIQVTLPVILSLFLATSWNHFDLSSMERRFDSVDKKFDSVDKRFDSIVSDIKEIKVELKSLDQRLGRVESKLGIP